MDEQKIDEDALIGWEDGKWPVTYFTHEHAAISWLKDEDDNNPGSRHVFKCRIAVLGEMELPPPEPERLRFKNEGVVES